MSGLVLNRFARVSLKEVTELNIARWSFTFYVFLICSGWASALAHLNTRTDNIVCVDSTLVTCVILTF